MFTISAAPEGAAHHAWLLRGAAHGACYGGRACVRFGFSAGRRHPAFIKGARGVSNHVAPLDDTGTCGFGTTGFDLRVWFRLVRLVRLGSWPTSRLVSARLVSTGTSGSTARLVFDWAFGTSDSAVRRVFEVMVDSWRNYDESSSFGRDHLAALLAFGRLHHDWHRRYDWR